MFFQEWDGLSQPVTGLSCHPTWLAPLSGCGIDELQWEVLQSVTACSAEDHQSCRHRCWIPVRLDEQDIALHQPMVVCLVIDSSVGHQIATVPSESIHTPWPFPHFVVLHPIKSIQIFFTDLHIILHNFKVEFVFLKSLQMSWVNKYSNPLLWQA
jgi:hypothetical protein